MNWSSSAASVLVTDASCFEPEEDGCDVECGLIVRGEFVGAHGNAAPMFEPVDAAFARVAEAVSTTVEGDRAAAAPAAALPVGLLVTRFGNDRADSAPAQVARIARAE